MLVLPGAIMTDVIRIVLADDHTLLRAGVTALLNREDDMAVVGEACTGEEAIERVAELAPDVVVMDLSMPGMGGLEATRTITRNGTARVIVLTMHEEDDHLLLAVQAGASGYVRKTSADQDLIRAVRAVARGDVFVHPGAVRRVLKEYSRQSGSDAEKHLTTREREVMTLTAEGFSATEIGRKLAISPKTVDTYRARIMEKLELHHRSELVHFALRAGMLKV
jgi:two-component system response regulator NreC